MVQIRIGGTAFKQRVNCSNEHVRIMEVAGVINPSKSESGYRQFTPADVAAAKRWMRENTRQRASA